MTVLFVGGPLNGQLRTFAHRPAELRGYRRMRRRPGVLFTTYGWHG